ALHDPERRLALLRKDLRDRATGLEFNLMVAVHQLKAQPPGHQPADRALAGAHEADQVEVDVRSVHHAPTGNGHPRPMPNTKTPLARAALGASSQTCPHPRPITPSPVTTPRASARKPWPRSTPPTKATR